jgi:hypothetical protein
MIGTFITSEGEDRNNQYCFISGLNNKVRCRCLLFVLIRQGEGGARAPRLMSLDFLIAGGIYSVTALRENDQERVTVYTKHRLTLQALVTETEREPFGAYFLY